MTQAEKRNTIRSLRLTWLLIQQELPERVSVDTMSVLFWEPMHNEPRSGNYESS